MIQVAERARQQEAVAARNVVADGNVLRSILVATDGTRAAGAALRISAVLARSSGEGNRITALTVLESSMSYVSDALLDHGDLRRNAVESNNVMDKVARQLSAVGLAHCTLRVAFGDPGRAIADVASEVGSSLIVIGRGRHRLLSRMLGSETFTHILSRARVPMLVVDSSARTLPKSVVCAVDFGQSSITSVHAAIQLAAPGATVHLVHVAPSGNGLQSGWQRVYTSGVEDAFARLRAGVVRTDIEVRSHLLFGEITPVLSDFMVRSAADLITLGAHNRAPVAAFVLGSVTTDLLRSQSTSLLVSPDITSEPSDVASAARPVEEGDA